MMDMHCHLDLYSNPEDIIKECIENKLYVLSVTTTPKSWNGTLSLTKGIERFNTSLGLHPQLAHLREQELDLFDSIIPSVKYIGEIGLDGSKEYKPYLDCQLRVFRHILKKCVVHKPIMMSIHSLGAVSMVLDELEQHPNAGVPVLHWFLGSKKELNRAVDLGCMFSIGPAMTESIKGKKVIDWVPRDRVLIETDGPFAKVDSKKVRPVDSFIVVKHLSIMWGMSESGVTRILRRNLRCLVSDSITND